MNTLHAPRRAEGRLLVGLAVAAAGMAGLWFSQPRASTQASDAPAFCTTTPPEAQADVTQPPDRQVATSVPMASPRYGDAVSSLEVRQGDVVRVQVRSPRAGGVAVHGLLDTTPVVTGSEITVAFRAIYSGRFPLHFHGADGSHFEVMVFQVMPRKS
jgi:hypothetical protein